MDREKIKQGVRLLLEGMNENPEREGLIETPERIARMYEEIFGGMNEDPGECLSKTFEVSSADMVVEKDITFYSNCEHHMVPFYGKAHIGYIPNGRVVGISKLARTVEIFAKRLQLQEKLTGQIAEALMNHLSCFGVIVVIEAEHMCMTMRGVKKPGSKTVSVVTKGNFETDKDLRDQFFQMLQVS